MPRGKRSVQPQPEKLTARIVSYKWNYFVKRVGPMSDAIVDDEAEIEVEAAIEQATGRHAKHVGESISFKLLHSERYAASAIREAAFFGSITLRGNRMEALAYLPKEPFWALPSMISDGADVIDCSFQPMRGGYGDLLSLYVGRTGDLQ